MNLNIVIFGASGPTGLALTRQALARGYRVTAITRRPAAFELNHEGYIIPGRLKTARQDLANFMLNNIADEQFVRKAVAIGSAI